MTYRPRAKETPGRKQGTWLLSEKEHQSLKQNKPLYLRPMACQNRYISPIGEDGTWGATHSVSLCEPMWLSLQTNVFIAAVPGFTKPCTELFLILWRKIKMNLRVSCVWKSNVRRKTVAKEETCHTFSFLASGAEISNQWSVEYSEKVTILMVRVKGDQKVHPKISRASFGSLAWTHYFIASTRFLLK